MYLYFTMLSFGGLTPWYPIYLDVIKAFGLALTIILGGWFTVHSIKNYKKKDD